MKIPVPVGASALKSEIPKAGLYPGRLVACQPNEAGDGLMVAWEFTDPPVQTHPCLLYTSPSPRDS